MNAITDVYDSTWSLVPAETKMRNKSIIFIVLANKKLLEKHSEYIFFKSVYQSK